MADLMWIVVGDVALGVEIPDDLAAKVTDAAVQLHAPMGEPDLPEEHTYIESDSRSNATTAIIEVAQQALKRGNLQFRASMTESGWLDVIQSKV